MCLDCRRTRRASLVAEREQLITSGLCDDCGRPFAKKRLSRTRRCLSCKTSTCEVCGVGFRPSRGGAYEQRTCSRACGKVIRTARERSRWPACKIHVLICAACEDLYVARSPRHLHDRILCRLELQRRRADAARRRWVEIFGRGTASGKREAHLSYVERLLSRFVVTDSGCWRWTGTYTAGGYGAICGPDGTTTGAHRAMWEHFVGPIGAGLDLDHQCHNLDRDCPGGIDCPHRGCVNPSHLRELRRAEHNAVTRARAGS